MTAETTWKRCGVCGEKKPIDAFGLHNHARDGHKRICLDCGEHYGYNSRSLKRKQVPQTLARPKQPKQPAPPPTAPVAPAVTPLFITAGPYRFGLSSIAMVDTRQPGIVEIKLNIHEVNGHGFPEALSFSFDGTDAVLLLAALDNVTGAADTQLETLRNELRRVEEERDAAVALAEELEQKQKALRQLVGA